MLPPRKQVGGTHYEILKIQPKEYIRANGLDFFEGNVVKYITRHRNKEKSKDILKVIDYALMILEDEYGRTFTITETTSDENNNQ